MDIREFAARVGVSTATVSLAFSGRRPVSPATRKMVMEKAEELGYVPNINGRRLATGRNSLVSLGILGHSVGYDPTEDPATIKLIAAMLQSLSARSYDMSINLIAKEAREFACLWRRKMKSRGVDGTMLFAGRQLPSELINEIAKTDHPCVVISTDAIEPRRRMSSLVIGARVGVAQSVELLVRNGHRRIGFIDNGVHGRIANLFDEELGKYGLTLSDKVLIDRDNVEEGARGLRMLMSRTIPPTAIVACTDVIALGAMHEAKSLGLCVPRDLSIIGTDDLWPQLLMETGLTTMRLDCSAIGEKSVEMLFRLMDDPNAPATTEVVENTLVIRDTVGPASK